MSQQYPDERLDAAIDRVARQMTAGAPRADFVGRVQERIADREGGGWLPRFAWAAAAAGALLIVALLLPWQTDDVPERRAARQVAQQPHIPAAGDAGPRSPASRGIGETHAKQAAREPRKVAPPQRRRLLPVPLMQDAPEIPALSEITPLSVDVTVPASLTLDDIELPDLAVPPLDPDRVDKES